jgi:hypothetical protein
MYEVYIRSFQQNWDRSVSTEKVIYKPTVDEAKVRVVREGMTGNKETFIFKVKRNQKVWVSLHENLIYLPSASHLKQDGDNVPIEE